MTVKNTPLLDSMTLDKQWLQQQFAHMDARTGFVPDTAATAETVQAQMLAAGVRPEDNFLSRDILRERYPDAPEESA